MSGITSLAPFAALVALAAVPQVTQVPEPAKPAMPITGSVAIAGRPEVVVANAPVVDARQLGAWRVALDGTPWVALTGPGFLEPGGAYRVTWAGTGRTERVRIVASRGGGWFEVQAADAPAGKGTRWINAGAAAAIERAE